MLDIAQIHPTMCVHRAQKQCVRIIAGVGGEEREPKYMTYLYKNDLRKLTTMCNEFAPKKMNRNKKDWSNSMGLWNLLTPF